MKFAQKIVLLILTAYVFIGSVGVGVYSHFCEKDGTEQSYFVRQEPKCEKVVEKEDICCSHETKTSHEKDCCSDDVQLVQTDFDYFQTYNDISFIAVFLPTFDFFIENKFVTSTEVNALSFANPPPKKSGTELLILHQTFLI